MLKLCVGKGRQVTEQLSIICRRVLQYYATVARARGVCALQSSSCEQALTLGSHNSVSLINVSLRKGVTLLNVGFFVYFKPVRAPGFPLGLLAVWASYFTDPMYTVDPMALWLMVSPYH